MISASQNYWDAMSSGIRPVGEMRVRWIIDDETTIVLTSDELSMNGGTTYETYFDPLMTELPYTKFSFTILDEDGLYDPMGLTENPLEPMQKVEIVYRQYLDNDMSTYEDIDFDTLYTTGESAYNNKEFTVYCQDRLSIAFNSEDVYVEDDTAYTIGDRYVSRPDYSGSYHRYFGSETSIQIVESIIDDLGISYIDNRTNFSTSDYLPLEMYIEKNQKKVDLLQAIANSKLWAIFMKNDIAYICSIDSSEETSVYSITNEDIYSYPVVENMTQAKQMTVHYHTYEFAMALSDIEKTITSSSSHTDADSGDSMQVLKGSFTGDAMSPIMTVRYNSAALKGCFFTLQKTNAYDGSFGLVFDETTQNIGGETYNSDYLSLQFRPLADIESDSVYPSTIIRNGELKTLDNRYVSASDSDRVSEFYYNYSVPKNRFSLTFRGEPCLELNDLITVETEWENNVICRVCHIMLSFNGALESTLSLQRVVV